MILPSVAPSAADVGGHYDELDAAYRRIWGEHVHHGYWRTGRETPEQAVEALLELVAERLALVPGASVCDIGCGYGAGAQWFAERHDVAVTGLTLSGVQHRIAAGRAARRGRLAFLRRDWLANGLADASFHAAYAIESSEHMADKGRFFAEASRVLRPGGRLVVCAWLADAAATPWQVRHLLEPICREGRLAGMGTREEYEDWARSAGFAELRYDDIGQAVRRTWSICARRLAWRLLTDREMRALALARTTRNRDFLLSVPRLMLALRSGAMRYGIFAWRKPA